MLSYIDVSARTRNALLKEGLITYQLLVEYARKNKTLTKIKGIGKRGEREVFDSFPPLFGEILNQIEVERLDRYKEIDKRQAERGE